MIQLTTPKKSVHGQPGVASVFKKEQEEGGLDSAFLKEVRDDQKHLRQLMQAIENSLNHRRDAKVNPSFVADLFARLRDQLACHFSLEESMGYLGEFTAAAPRLCRKADLLQSQHTALYDEICSIADDAEALCRPNEKPIERRRMAIRHRYIEFRSHLRHHNSEEDDLIVEVLYFDIGGGD